MKSDFFRRSIGKIALSIPVIAMSVALSAGIANAEDITIIKSAPDHQDGQDFNFTGDLGTFTLDDDNDPTYSNSYTIDVEGPGPIVVNEGAVDGWIVAEINCDDSDGGTVADPDNRTVTIDVDEDQDITCTFLNQFVGGHGGDQEQGTITIVQDTDPEDGDKAFFYDSTFGSFILDDNSKNNNYQNSIMLTKPVGKHVITQTKYTDWKLTDIDCDDPDGETVVDLANGQVILDLDNNEHVVCTFTNSNLTGGGAGDDDDDDDDTNIGDDDDDDDDDTNIGDDDDDDDDDECEDCEECGTYLNDFIHIGWNNDPEEVTKLQEFLNEEMDSDLEVTGVYDNASFEAVKDFQEKYSEQILDPWGIDYSTGFVYLTTRRWINLLKCPELDIPMPELIPYNQR